MTNNNTSKGLYDDEIDCLGSRMLKGTLTRWMGVFARDEVPSEKELLRPTQMQFDNRPFAFVFNNQPASEPGQHWLAIYGSAAPLRGGSLAAATQTSIGGLHIDVEFFDSYALPPATYSLHSHFKSISHFSQHPLQSPSSALCGHYYLYFLFARSHGLSFPFIISRLAQHHPRPPDAHVYSSVCKYITARAASLAPCNSRTRPNHHRQCSQIKCSFC